MKRTDFKILCLIAFVVTFAACGIDWFPEFKRSATTPDPFSFTSKFGVPIQAQVSSNTVTITGFANSSTASPISVSSGSSYSINGATPISSSSNIKNNQRVYVVQTTAGTPGTVTISTLTIGPTSQTFTTITQTIRTPLFSVVDTTQFPGATELTSDVISATDSGVHSISISGSGTPQVAIADSNNGNLIFQFTANSLSVPILNGNHIRVLIPNNTAGKTVLTIDNTNYAIDNATHAVTASPK